MTILGIDKCHEKKLGNTTVVDVNALNLGR